MLKLTSMLTSPIIKYVLIIGVILGLVFGIYHTGYTNGSNSQKVVYVAQQTKANDKIIIKNDVVKESADKQEAVQIVYKDRIVTKYRTIEKEVVRYENSPNASVVLDSEFVRLHNNSADPINSQVASTKPSSITDDSTARVEDIKVTTGQAIGVISNNYESYYACKLQVAGWIQFYSDLQKKINE